MIRKTTQYSLPLHRPQALSCQYDPYPVYALGEGKIHTDFNSLSDRLSGSSKVIIDGYGGVLFDDFAKNLSIALARKGIVARWWFASVAMKSETEIESIVEPFLGGDDPIFGFRTSLELSDFYDLDKLRSLASNAGQSPNGGMDILIGPGAALAGWEGTLVYLDIPKNEIQFRSRAGSVTNLGVSIPDSPKKMYKRFYFVDWVVLNKHKKKILPQIDIFVDAQREVAISWAEGADLREALDRMSSNAFRVRPWFEPGAWGGQWIREHIHSLPSSVPNYAWSFELIVPENGLIFESDEAMLELSFDTLMFEAGEKVVGEDCYSEYADEFPIRLDYLDNMCGKNLSVQCHPRKEFIQKNFGEVLTQEETYYILQTTPGAVVHLGFKDDIDPAEFETALNQSFEKAQPLDVEKYVNDEPAVKHGLYLIPPGTLHSSGIGNLVLEISTTPYIFTFKMYDWMSLDLDGRPRPLNIKRAMENLYFDRKGEKIAREFVSHPSLLESGDGWELWHLPTHPKHSYDVHRYHLTKEVEVTTEGKCHVLNLVEGESAKVITAAGEEFHLNYAESMVVCAAAGSYRLISDTGSDIMVIKAFMK